MMKEGIGMGKKIKVFHFGQCWQVYGKNSIEVPAHFTIEQAQAYVKKNWDEVGLAPDAEYLMDSDEPDFEDCEFGDY